MRRFASLLTAGLLLSACQQATDPGATENNDAMATAEYSSAVDYLVVFSQRQQHGADDDLLSAGLGRSGLLAEAPGSESDTPQANELRRLAIYHGWRAVAHLSGEAASLNLLDELPIVEGEEISALLQLDSAEQPFRVVVQIPDNRDASNPCLVVAPASGSRGVWGALALAGPWALPKGCAVVYTDKGLGSDVVFFDDATGVGLNGQRRSLDRPPLAFSASSQDQSAVATPHAHSADHPEADWGQHVLASAHFAWQQLPEPDSKPRIIALGLSNGANAVLRAAEADANGLLDAVVAISPNITVAGQPPLYDYATLAALYQPCLLADAEQMAQMTLANPMLAGVGQQRCESLAEAGLLPEPSPQAARQILLEAGFDQTALNQAAVNVALDLWRSIAVTYASAYLRRGPDEMPCGYVFEGSALSAAEREVLWTHHSGVVPSAGLSLTDTLAGQGDAAFAGLHCLRKLWQGDSNDSQALRHSVEQTLATAQLPHIPVLLMHGREDGLIPIAISARPYAEQARRNGANIAYLEISPAQHFDTLLAAPGVAQQFVPLLPYAWLGLNHITAVLDGEAALTQRELIEASPPQAGQRLGREHLGWFEE